MLRLAGASVVHVCCHPLTHLGRRQEPGLHCPTFPDPPPVSMNPGTEVWLAPWQRVPASPAGGHSFHQGRRQLHCVLIKLQPTGAQRYHPVIALLTFHPSSLPVSDAPASETRAIILLTLFNQLPHCVKSNSSIKPCFPDWTLIH